jgi:hypothetical protein
MPSKVILIGAISLAAFTTAYVGRGAIAREHPGIPAFYSFDGEAFTFDRRFEEGDVGPFSVGSDKQASLEALDHYGKSFILTMPMSKQDEEKLYYTRQTNVTPDARRILIAADQWKISFREQGAVTVYHVQFSAGHIRSIDLLSTLGA